MFHVLGEKWGWQESTAKAWLARFHGSPAYEQERARAGSSAGDDDDGDDDDDDPPEDQDIN